MDAVFLALSSPGPDLLRLGPIVFRWYGVLIALSVLIGLNVSNRLSKERGLEPNIINDLLPILVLAAVVGARIYYVLFEWRNYKYNLFETFAIWNGGIAIHGALIGGCCAVFLVCKIKRVSFGDVFDVIVPSLALGQAIGRWGNFFNNEAFGLPSNLPWKLYIPDIFRPKLFQSTEYFHPTFLYESLWNIFIFSMLIFLFYQGKRGKINLPSGALSCIYLIGYSLGRVWIEQLRIDPLCIGALPPLCSGGIRMAQLMSFVLIVVGCIALALIYRRKAKILNFSRDKEN